MQRDQRCRTPILALSFALPHRSDGELRKEEDKKRSVYRFARSYCCNTWQMNTHLPAEMTMLLHKYIEQFFNFIRTRTIIGFVGTVSVNLFSLGAVEYLTSVVRLPLA